MITFDEASRAFHLRGDQLSLVLKLRENELMMCYLGAPLNDPEATHYLSDLRAFLSFDTLRTILPYACPTEGRGDYRPPMIRVKQPSGQRCTELQYTSHRIESGKPKLAGLPATYTESPDEAETLTITLRDPYTALEVDLSYTIFKQHAAIAQSALYRNAGQMPLVLDGAGSMCLSLPGQYDLLHLHGAWGRERMVQRLAPAALTRTVQSTRGASGHEHNPFVALLDPKTDEFSGECYGVNLVYSGDFAISVDEDGYNSTRILASINPSSFEWQLAPGETFQSPEAICVHSTCGLNGMSQALHRLYRTRLCRGTWRDKLRPILINNWEATYHNFDHDKIMDIAHAAADVGVELFVLDDGWFGHRDSDNSSLGDWVVDRRKLPNGLDALAKDINALGLQFGLWVEPEMISPDSDLYRAHPDWCLHAEGRPKSESRQQLILDMSRADVQDYVVEAIGSVLRSAPISYIKWDMNRNYLEAGSALLNDGRQGEVAHRYMLGLYRVMEQITTSFPDVLFESCSGGSGRFDPGMLHYMPQTWTSDDTDAIERLYIQYGTSMAYPISAMGAHVSAVPNHQVGRVTSMRMRGDVAIGGNFGYELDLSKQSPEDIEEIRRQIEQVKAVRSTTQQGTFTRLLSPFEGDLCAWQFHDEHRAILCSYIKMMQPNPRDVRVRMRNLPEDATYRTPSGQIISARALMQVGVRPQFEYHDFTSSVMIFDRI
ncbi:alpha-galactosidase [Eubacteriales bacterium OttesenSCG-928-N13]|nr:alpha-galactosidase [Eubacteriales bacterium OttesenSCG-928-N13]